MSEISKINLTYSLDLTPDIMLKIDECVKRHVEMMLPDLLEQYLDNSELDAKIEKVIETIIGDEREYDIKEITKKVKNEVNLNKSEKIFLQKHIVNNLAEEFKHIKSGQYMAISLDGTILLQSSSKLDLLKELNRLKITSNKIFIQRKDEPIIGRV